VPVPVPVPVPDPVPALLDGATGTELMHRGASLHAPYGSALSAFDDPATLAAIHQDYARAGAQILTTATLCAHAGDPSRIESLATTAVALARAAASPPIAIAGSIGPHAAAPPHARPAYRELARALVHAGCDLLLLETMIDPEHAAVALQAASEVADGRPIWLAIACGPGGRLLGGATLDDLFAKVDAAKLRALLVSCTELGALDPALQALAPHRQGDLWVGASPNTGRTRQGRHDPTAHAPASLVEPLVQLVHAHRLDVVGGCCGTDPAFVASLRAALHPDPEARALAEARLHRALRR
jgi:methionine synthase I (cobalamin-dependent)